MGLKKGTPGKGGQGRVDSFSYTPVAQGTKGSFAAWMAAEAYWCLAHEHTDREPGTKPCLDWMTDGALRCKRCRPHTRATWIGYVPLYREEDHSPIMVIVHESAMDLLTGLKFPARVLVGRTGEKSSVFVKRAETQVPFKTDNEQRKCSRDITGDLLNIWGLPELETWLMEQRQLPRGTAVQDSGEPFSPMMQGAAKRNGATVVPDGPSAASFDAIRDRLKSNAEALKPSTNGKHKPRE